MTSQRILSWFANGTCSNSISNYNSQGVKQNNISAYMRLNAASNGFEVHCIESIQIIQLSPPASRRHGQNAPFTDSRMPFTEKKLTPSFEATTLKVSTRNTNV